MKGVRIVEEQHEVLDLIEQITRNDGTSYYEIGNMVQNGRAELAAERGFIKEVRILQLNIPHSQNVIKYEHFINTHYKMQDESMDHWDEWKRTPEADKIVHDILEENHIG
ncbi:hypothetical protein HMPREF0549_0770 [Limosilactobacillus vaginalis DSM 5837 = ATCC 49540]|jgi:hypothetical protein|uniref:Uncharacterized protein n=1 Tax=Limosilactobacillus vaginalis DSM 5837 = ATCC 49540 TaxID=1423814 RepID=C2ETI4_9LACO|nr:hypothetical protein HMPREF0549_0770 [Limosilactobacillus vaginalis DSM 5837 = ATCC 49540]